MQQNDIINSHYFAVAKKKKKKKKWATEWSTRMSSYWAQVWQKTSPSLAQVDLYSEPDFSSIKAGDTWNYSLLLEDTNLPGTVGTK